MIVTAGRVKIYLEVRLKKTIRYIGNGVTLQQFLYYYPVTACFDLEFIYEAAKDRCILEEGRRLEILLKSRPHNALI